MAGTLSETGFLRDIATWAVQGHIDFVNEINTSIDQLTQHNAQVIKEHQHNDQAGAQKVKGTLSAANSNPQ